MILQAMEVTFRRATQDDSDLLADLVLGDPGLETRRVTARLFGVEDVEVFRGLFREVWRAAENWKLSELILVDGKVAGLLQTGRSSMRITPRVLWTVLRAFGPLGSLRLVRRLRVQERVVPAKPPDAYLVSELHVRPGFRGKGVGAMALQRAEEDARVRGFEMMALTTLTTNPARALYERCGFTVAGEATDPEFEEITGAAGNVLYTKTLR